MRAWILGFAVFIATEASVAAVSREPAFDETELLAGLALNLAAYDVDVPTRDQVFALDEEMRTFIAPVKAFRTPQQKMQALIRGLEEHGMFSLDYAEITRTASRTFHDRQGNCLSFTMLFVTLARAAGLSASFQRISVEFIETCLDLPVAFNQTFQSIRLFGVGHGCLQIQQLSALLGDFTGPRDGRLERTLPAHFTYLLIEVAQSHPAIDIDLTIVRRLLASQ